MKNIFYYDMIIGKLGITDNGKEILEIGVAESDLAGISTGHEKQSAFQNNYIINETPLIKKAYAQLSEYFKGERKVFDLPLKLEGTEFQKKVWKALIDIPYGETRTYKQIAETIGCPKGCRAVGNANNKNNIMIVISCHRVIGSNGDLVGYASGLDIKRKLLQIEGTNKCKIE